eukprot:3276929-Amphidinium_carterae.1
MIGLETLHDVLRGIICVITICTFRKKCNLLFGEWSCSAVYNFLSIFGLSTKAYAARAARLVWDGAAATLNTAQHGAAVGAQAQGCTIRKENTLASVNSPGPASPLTS